MYVHMFMVLLHDFVVFVSFFDEIHVMSLYEVVLLYIHNVGLSDYVMNILLA